MCLRGGFHRQRLDVGALNAAAGGYFALSDMGAFVALGLRRGSGAGAGPGGG